MALAPIARFVVIPHRKPMFTTVRYFIKTSIAFLLFGIVLGVYMTLAKEVWDIGVSPDLVSAHTHVILVGFVMMMIMGVALWFFPRAEKDDARYNPDRIRVIYWIIVAGTAGRVLAQLLVAATGMHELRVCMALFGVVQGIGMILYFWSIWGRIRAVGSQFREAKGEKF
jgi:heme/copper-type cytochrome/quinol oxidase subunit 1